LSTSRRTSPGRWPSRHWKDGRCVSLSTGQQRRWPPARAAAMTKTCRRARESPSRRGRMVFSFARDGGQRGLQAGGADDGDEHGVGPGQGGELAQSPPSRRRTGCRRENRRWRRAAASAAGIHGGRRAARRIAGRSPPAPPVFAVAAIADEFLAGSRWAAMTPQRAFPDGAGGTEEDERVCGKGKGMGKGVRREWERERRRAGHLFPHSLDPFSSSLQKTGRMKYATGGSQDSGCP